LETALQIKVAVCFPGRGRFTRRFFQQAAGTGLTKKCEELLIRLGIFYAPFGRRVYLKLH
jgi:hypothetical protein